MNKYSNITIEYLEGFECEEFKIENGHYIGLRHNEKAMISSIYEIKGWNAIVLDGIYGKNKIALTTLDYSMPSDKIILNDMLTYCKYNKRKSIIESL